MASHRSRRLVPLFQLILVSTVSLSSADKDLQPATEARTASGLIAQQRPPTTEPPQAAGTAAPGEVVLELQQILARTIEHFQAMDQAGVLARVSDQYRTGPLTKAAIGDQLRVIFTLYDTVRARVRIDEVRIVGDLAWIYSTGEVSGRLRGFGTWTSVLSWQHELEIARQEQGRWRLYGHQQ